MLAEIKRLLAELHGGGKHGTHFDAGDYRVAAAALLVHVATLDHDLTGGARQQLGALLKAQFSLTDTLTDELIEAAVAADRFLGPDHRWAGHWASTPRNPRDVPEDRLLSGEARERIAAAIDALPENHRAVITLRDVDGFDSTEACEILGISEANQRVLLHRARSKVRGALETYMREGEVSS